MSLEKAGISPQENDDEVIATLFLSAGLLLGPFAFRFCTQFLGLNLGLIDDLDPSLQNSLQVTVRNCLLPALVGGAIGRGLAYGCCSFFKQPRAEKTKDHHQEDQEEEIHPLVDLHIC